MLAFPTILNYKNRDIKQMIFYVAAFTSTTKDTTYFAESVPISVQQAQMLCLW